jgi:hypothetical protein
MIAETEPWPEADTDGRPVRFTSRQPRPRIDEYTPVLEGTAVRLEPLQETHLDARNSRTAIPFVTILKDGHHSERIIGTTRERGSS